tara:strand:- start:1394 stop:1753 length:360 start_codon:yes stop_codon:yes gene_type:complete
MRDQQGSGIATFLSILGGVLIVAGAALLLYLGILIMDALRDPQSIGLFAEILAATGRSGNGLEANLGGVQFQLSMEEPISTLLFVVVAIWVLGAFAGIVRSIIQAGTSLIETAKGWRTL